MTSFFIMDSYSSRKRRQYEKSIPERAVIVVDPGLSYTSGSLVVVRLGNRKKRL